MPEDEAPQPEPPQVNIRVNADGMLLQITPQPVIAALAEPVMNQIVTDWCAQHPAFFEQLVVAYSKKKRQEIALITDIHRTKLH